MTAEGRSATFENDQYGRERSFCHPRLPISFHRGRGSPWLLSPVNIFRWPDRPSTDRFEFSMKSKGVVDDAPEARMVQMLGGYRITQLLHVATKLGIADELAAGPKSVEKLAETTGSHRPSLYRLLRCLASVGVFAERTHGTFEITPLASTLRSDVHNSMHAFALSCGEPWWWSAFGELFYTVKTGETGFNHVQGVSFFEYLNKHPDAARVFNANMTSMTRIAAKAV